MVAYVRIEYSTYQFSEESKGGRGMESIPPGPCGTEKKRGPERVKKESTFKHAIWLSMHPAELYFPQSNMCKIQNVF